MTERNIQAVDEEFQPTDEPVRINGRNPTATTTVSTEQRWTIPPLSQIGENPEALRDGLKGHFDANLPFEPNYYQGAALTESNDEGFNGAVMVPDGRVVFIPTVNFGSIGLYDPVSDTYQQGPGVNGGEFNRAALARRLNNEYRALTNFSLPAPIEGGPRFRRERIVGYLIARKAVADLGLLAIPLIPVYIYEAATEGIWMKVDAFLASGPLVQGAVLIVASTVVYLLSRIDPSEWRDLYLASVRAGSRNAVRTLLLARGLPILAIVAAVLLGTAFGLPAWIIAAAALATGLVVRGLGKLWKRLTYRARQIDVESTLPNVDVMVDHITTPDGDRITVARVHTHWLAWPREDVLRDQIIRDIEAYFEDGSPEDSLPSLYYDHLQEVGRVDAEEVVESTRAEARSELEALVQPSSAPREVVEDRLYGAYPDRIVDSVLRDSQRVGRISEGDDAYYWHDHHAAD